MPDAWIGHDLHRVAVGSKSGSQLKAIAGIYGMVFSPKKEQGWGVTRSHIMDGLSID